MTDNYYLVMVGKDSLICQIVDDENNLELDQKEEIVKSIKTPFITLTNIVNIMFDPKRGKQVFVPYDKTDFGHKFLTANVSQISEIQFVNEDIATQVRAVITNLVLAR